MVRSLAGFFTRIMQRWMPDAFLLAVLLTFFVLLSGIIVEHKSPAQMITYWGDGLWGLLSFSMQVLLTLLTGHVLAQTPAVQKALAWVAGLTRTPAQAIILTTLVAMAACWLSWGFGLIASALFAREIARRNAGVHFPLLVASAYSGMLIWHAGLSGSIPLQMAVLDSGALGELMHGQTVGVEHTIFSPEVLLICLLIALSVPILNTLMMPAAGEVQEITDTAPVATEDGAASTDALTPAQRLERARVISLLLGGIGLYYLYRYFSDGNAMGLNTVNMMFLVAGIMLHRNPMSYLSAVQDAIRCTSGIVVQFPLYAGIMGIMVQSGLAASVSQWFVSISTPDTFALYTFFSAGLVNMFVPSGGGQWAVQAPIVIPAAEAMGVPLNRAAMAVAFGDAWTNMIQPFWTLPLLGIAGLGLRDIMGYCTVVLLWSGLVISAGIYFLF